MTLAVQAGDVDEVGVPLLVLFDLMDDEPVIEVGVPLRVLLEDGVGFGVRVPLRVLLTGGFVKPEDPLPRIVAVAVLVTVTV